MREAAAHLRSGSTPLILKQRPRSQQPGRIEHGNFSTTKGVGAGVYECRIDFGPGYRIYFGKDGETVVILLAGGTKKRQNEDILAAQKQWNDYKERKAKET